MPSGHSSSPTCRPSRARWSTAAPRCPAQCRHHRLAKRENSGKGGRLRGFDAGKKVKGVKRHVIVDTLGLVPDAIVTPADWQDRDGGLVLIGSNEGRWARLQTIFADAGYAGKLVERVELLCGWQLEIVKRSDLPGFQVARKRWIVERTLAWLGKCRRLSKDYERLFHTSRSLIHVAMIGLMVRRLTP